MNSELFEHLNRFNTNPYLFIGSGMSRRYLGLPTWENLLQLFFTTSLLPNEFEYFQSKANNNLPLLATELAKEFHETWWKEAKYKDSRTLNKELAKQKLNIPLKIEIANLLSEIQQVQSSFTSEIELLKTSVIDGVITTNWDTFLESVYSDFKVYIGQQELLFSESISIGEIYKIHGSITKPDSLVLTQEDYADFNDRNAYLAAKLLTIFVEHPIIFIGYSLSDENIQQIIDSIVTCVEPKNLDKLKDRLIFVEWAPNTKFEMKDSSMKLPGNKVLPIKLIKTDSFEPLFATLSTLKRQIPVKVLRKLRNSVVELVKSSRPSSKIFVKDIDAITDETDIEYAIGVGIVNQFISSTGYKAIEASDIIEDVLNDNRSFDVEQLLEHAIPRLHKGNAYIPVFKYLRAANLLTKTGTLNAQGVAKIRNKFSLKNDIPNCFLPTVGYRSKQVEIRRNHKDISTIDKAYDKVHSLNYIPLLELKALDLAELLRYLRVCSQDNTLKRNSSFRKLVCLYDYLKYGIG